MESEPPVNPFERRLRFGCGLIFGAGAGLVLGFEVTAAFSVRHWLCVAGSALLCGFLAMRFGDGFWRTLPDWVRWW